MSLPDAVALEIARGNFLDTGTFKTALYTVPLTGVTAQLYAVTNETTGTGYSAGGFTMAPLAATYWQLSGATAVFGPANVVSAAGSTFTFDSLLVYIENGAQTNNGLYFFNAGVTQTVSNGTLTIVWPTADATTGLVRVPQ